MDIHKGMKRLKLQLSKYIYDLLFKRKVISKTNNHLCGTNYICKSKKYNNNTKVKMEVNYYKSLKLYTGIQKK